MTCLVRRYGKALVDETCITEMGYPSLWVASENECSYLENQIMAKIDFDFTGVTESDLESGGFEPVTPGRYHVRVGEINDSFQKYPTSVVVDFLILNGTTPGEDMKTHREFLSTSLKAIRRIAKFAIAAGCMQPSDLGKNLTVDLAPSVGRELVVEIEEHSYEDANGNTRDGARVTFMGFHSIGSPEAEGVPLAETRQATGDGIPAEGGGGGFADL